ncbi:DUF4179 domain-containing protein [Neobacillus sp. D3-1R]|uniref:DUF4179 domain-containing protein n=1 Tax=Neobacillus sp. D3-1R TaxID=3445778 RepID=UPI003FA16594
MNCNAIQESLVDLLEGNLSEKNRQEVEKHLQQCGSCQEDWRKIQEVISILYHENESIEVPDQFMKNVKHKVESTQKKNKKLFKKQATMGLVAGLLLTFFVGTAFATNGFTSVMDWWQDLSHKENEKIEKNVQHGLTENLNLVSESNGVKVKVTNVVADDIQTLIYYEIEDTLNENNYMINFNDDFEIVNQAQIWKDSEESPIRSHFKLYSDSENVFRGRLALAPLSVAKGSIQLELKKLEKVANSSTNNEFYKSIPTGQNEFIDGEWSFTIPVKKHDVIVHELNIETQVEGNPVVIEKLTIAPTVTMLSYRYKSGDPMKKLNYIQISSLEANIKDYVNDRLGIQTGYTGVGSGKNGWISTEAMFDSLYLEQPKEIQIQFGSVGYTIEDHQQYKVDMTKKFPQTFEYLGNEISIEEIKIGHPTQILLKEALSSKRNYEVLNVKFYNKDGHGSGGSSINGFYVDKDGSTYKYEDYFYRLNSINQPRFFSSEHHIEMVSEDKEDIFIPVQFDIEGYTKTSFSDKKVKISLD